MLLMKSEAFAPQDTNVFFTEAAEDQIAAG